jgi:hypothetical protein
MHAIQSDSFRSRESEVLDENVRYTFEDEYDDEDEDEKQNDDEGGSSKI